MDEFECAFGHCTVSDEVLTVKRSNPETMGRWEVFRTGLTTSWEHQRRRTGRWLGKTALLGLAFTGLVAYLYTAFSVEPPLVIGMSVLGVIALLGPLEVAYRRALRDRRRIQQMLADEGRLSYPEQIPLDDITGVSIQSVSTGIFLTDGQIVVLEFCESGDAARTYLGFPKFMSDELETARSLFEQCIPITEKTHDE